MTKEEITKIIEEKQRLIETLQQEISNLQEEIINLEKPEIRRIIDSIFSENPKTDTILLCGYNQNENDSREYIEYDPWELYECINFVTNIRLDPITKFMTPVNPDKIEEKIHEELLSKIKSSIPDPYKDNNDGVNMYWYKVFAFSKDYKLFGFVVRDDGMAMNSYEGGLKKYIIKDYS